MQRPASPGISAQMPAPKAITVFVPTTGCLIAIRRISWRPSALAHVVTAGDDFQPVSISSEFDCLIRQMGAAWARPGGSWEINLERAFDTGASWQVPLCTAVWLAASGWKLADAGTSQLWLFATGAVDPSGAIAAGPYALPVKWQHLIRRFEAEATAGCRVLAFLPPDPERAALISSAVGSEAAFDVQAVETLEDLMHAVDGGPRSAGVDRTVPAPRAAWRRRVMIGGLVAAAILAASNIVPGLRGPTGPDTPATTLVPQQPAGPLLPSGQVNVLEGGVWVLRPAAGASCGQLAVSGSAPVRVETPAPARVVQIDPAICGVDWMPPHIGLGTFEVDDALQRRSFSVGDATAAGAPDRRIIRLLFRDARPVGRHVVRFQPAVGDRSELILEVIETR